jgi:phospholipid N-methyltransferase
MNFDARITTNDKSRACRLLRDEGSVIDAFRFGSSLSTTCTNFQIVIDIASMNNVPGWSVCFVRFSTVKITSAIITVANNPSTVANISKTGFVSQIINQVGNSLIINLKAFNDGKTVCTYEVQNIEVVACPLPPATTTPATTTATTTAAVTTTPPPITIPPSRYCNVTRTPLVNFQDSIGRFCNPVQGNIFTTTCSGACPTSSIGQFVFNNGLCVQPSTSSTQDACQCCKGTGQWVSYPITCAFIGGIAVNSTVAVFQLTTCDCF